MDTNLLLDNLTNPALLFFFLGILAVQVKSDLEFPQTSSKFISYYLLLSIGFKGGQELAHSQFTMDIGWAIFLGILLSVVVPLYTYFILRRKFNVYNSGAIAASYGSVSAVTFITTINFLEIHNISFGGHMIAVMALMEAPSIILGVLLVSLFNKQAKEKNVSIKSLLKHSLTNGSVFLILGSLLIGLLASEKQAQGIEPFTADIFQGFLAVFLLDMGIQSGKKINDFLKKGLFAIAFAICIPLLNGIITSIVGAFFISSVGDLMLLSILASSASYIAVPAAMKIAVPKANPSLYLPMALAVTFPFNITIGIPTYYYMIQQFHYV